MKNKSIDKATYLLLSLGLICHVYLAVSLSIGSDIKFIFVPVLNILPYVICLIMLIKANKSIVAFCVGLSILVTDIILFNSFLLNQSNQSAVGFAFLGIFAPVWKVALSIPIGCVIGLLIDKYIKARQQKEPEVTKPIQ